MYPKNSYTNNILLSLFEIVELHNILYEAFLIAEKESNVSVFNVRKQFRIWRSLKNNKLDLSRNYPWFQILASIAALIAPLTHGSLNIAALIFYTGSIFFTIKYRGAFLEQYSYHETGSNDIVNKAFGIDQISLHIFNLFDGYISNNNSKLDHKKLKSVINLVKSGHDYEAIRYGYDEHFRKLFFVGLFSLPLSGPLFFYHYHTEIFLYLSEVIHYLESKPLVFAMFVVFILTISIPMSLLIYSFAYGDKAAEKRKRRYLLLLTILKETYIEI